MGQKLKGAYDSGMSAPISKIIMGQYFGDKLITELVGIFVEVVTF